MDKNELMPVLRSCARTVCDRSWHWGNPVGSPATYVLWLIESGCGRIILDGTPETVRAGETLVIPMWKTVDGRHPHPEPFVVLWAVFAMCFADGTPADLREARHADYTFPLRRNLLDTPFFQKLFQRLLAEDSPAVRADYLRALWRELRYQDSFIHTRGMEPGVYREIAELCASIRGEPGQEWSVEEMARRFHYSPDHFSRLFQQATGQRPQDYVIAQRIAAARALLTFGSLPVSQIAARLGYCDVYHFCRQFRQKTGLTPLQARRGKIRESNME